MSDTNGTLHMSPRSGFDALKEADDGQLGTPSHALSSHSAGSPALSPHETSFEPIPFTGNNEEQDSDNVLSMSLPNIERSSWMGSRTPRRNSEITLSRYASKSYLASPKKWFKSSKRRRKAVKKGPYTIEYSVFHPIGYLPQILSEADFQEHWLSILRQERKGESDEEVIENFITTEAFEALVSAMTHDAEVDPELKPVRISQGSSGSYFVLGKREFPSFNPDQAFEIYRRGIYKPKDEEPYGPLSPKWSKWLHRTFFPCFFGRACLIPNLGYVSEAAACVLDRQLLSYIVPYTDIIYLRSSAFYSTFWARIRSKPPKFKIGSFQMFLNGYVEAQEFFRQHPLPTDIDKLPKSKNIETDSQEPLESLDLQFFWTKEIVQQFREELEKLVILDYIMRNTDRGADNWMIKLEWREAHTKSDTRIVYPYLRIGAIDSGLAFPWKHPDGWRSFPFGWLFLPYAIIGQPFSLKTRQRYLPLLTSKFWWEQTIIKLKGVFEKDADFKERMWRKQVAVLKGQAFNVVEVLKSNNAGPLELTRRESLLIWDDEMNVPVSVDDRVVSRAIETSIYDVNLGAQITSSRANDETTPLLEPFSKPVTKTAASIRSECSEGDPLRMSGFDYNLTYEEDDRLDGEGAEETDTKKVVIERLERVDARPPVFTWC